MLSSTMRSNARVEGSVLHPVRYIEYRMPESMTAPRSILSAVRVVLYEPQDPVNIAATIRAMKNMGCSHLYLVRSVEYDPWRLAGIAHDTDDIIERIKNCETIEEALAGVVRVAGFTARRRAAKRDVTTPRAASADLLEFAHNGPVAILFGREDKGLPNEILDRAHLLVTIPTTGHASLNLAQAVLLARCSAGDRRRVRATFCRHRARSLSDRFLQDAISRAHHENGSHAVLSCRSGFARARSAARDFHRSRADNRAHREAKGRRFAAVTRTLRHNT
ncbi:MAG: hypothetical protein DMD72_05240 [Gemmatimonadetes bacterium]|nr:MAG: hypothetical protein DMD72_05240 [Gemmatimonadota bacterium]